MMILILIMAIATFRFSSLIVFFIFMTKRNPLSTNLNKSVISRSLSDFNEMFSHNADRQRSPVMRLIPATTPSAPQWLIYSLGSPNFSCPVIAVREFVCHPMSGDNAHFFRSTRLCGLMLTKF